MFPQTHNTVFVGAVRFNWKEQAKATSASMLTHASTQPLVLSLFYRLPEAEASVVVLAWTPSRGDAEPAGSLGCV